MSLPPLTVFYILIAALPLLVVLYLMIGRNWDGARAGPAGYLIAILVSILFFGSNLNLLLVALGRSLLLSFFVLYIIWMALLLYNVMNEAGAIKVIGRELPGLAHDKGSQALLLSWVFGSFLQGASGFGVPAAVVAPLLVGLGFAPNPAVVIALVGHAWAVTYGSLGSSFFSLIAATGQGGDILAGPVAALLAVACLACGLAVLWESDRAQAVRAHWGQLIGVGLIMAAVQFGLAVAGLWSLAAFGAGLAGLAIMLFDLRFGLFHADAWSKRFLRLMNRKQLEGKEHRPIETQSIDGISSGNNSTARRSLFIASMPYLLLTVIIVLGQLVFNQPLSIVTIDPTFPEVGTSFGWITPAGPGRSVSLLGHAGALLMYTSILSYVWFRWQGTFDSKGEFRGRTILKKAARGSFKSTVGIVTLVAMAVTMQHSSMTQILAEVLSRETGPIFPLLSPFIGALGAFMTGSNTNSNVVFGQLQLDTATALGFSIVIILAAQTAGGAIGSLFAPSKVIVGASTVEGAQDGAILRRATAYGLGIVVLIGIVVSIVVWL